MLRPHCVPPLPEPETAHRAILLLGAAIALTLAATIEQRRPNGHKFCSAFELAFRHFRAGAFSATTTIYELQSRPRNISPRAAPVVRVRAAVRLFESGEIRWRLRHRPGFQSLFLPRSGT
jgi:hypothetical protein